VRIRGYRCIRRIAVGGSSSVFLAEIERIRESRVLKVFRQVPDVADGSTTFDRFLREYDLAARLDHPNIARIFDLGVADDHIYLAMEYFAGGDLRSRMRGPLPWREANIARGAPHGPERVSGSCRRIRSGRSSGCGKKRRSNDQSFAAIARRDRPSGCHFVAAAKVIAEGDTRSLVILARVALFSWFAGCRRGCGSGCGERDPSLRNAD
jgi:hypothetical protein